MDPKDSSERLRPCNQSRWAVRWRAASVSEQGGQVEQRCLHQRAGGWRASHGGFFFKGVWMGEFRLDPGGGVRPSGPPGGF